MLQTLIKVIIMLIAVYMLGSFLALDYNPLHWWLFTDAFGRFFAILIFILVLGVALDDETDLW
jgi:hypothetical protein